MTGKLLRQNLPGYYFIAPAFILLSVVTVFPYLYALYFSFQHSVFGRPAGFCGFDNFIRVISHPRFPLVIKNQFILVFVSGIFQFLLGFSGALALKNAAKGTYVIRSLILIPWVVPGVVCGLLWKWILDGNAGILNMILVMAGITDAYIPLLSSTRCALPCIIAVNIWRIFPFMMVMYLSALQSIPTDQYEAACIDGATPFQQLRYITIPNMMPIIVLTLILATIWNFKIFDFVWVLTQGGPANATEVFSTLIYKSSFYDLDFGFASAVAVIMAVIITIPIFLNLKFKKSE
ncbi:sugar ABC transporter permease [Treponema sp. OttesenSCG-928-L16]|nr:sugar ABC transporter permease [Treponema sp. OttesenSCG-928-L16]